MTGKTSGRTGNGRSCFARLMPLLLLLLCVTAEAAVTANVDRTRLSIEDSFTLVLRATAGEDLKQVDFSPLLKDFQATDSSSRSNITITNGRRESVKELHITLIPRRPGKLEIPPLEVDGQLTAAIGLMIEANRDNLSAAKLFFIEAEVSDTRVYVQSQLILRLRIYRSAPLTDISYNGLNLPGVVIEEVDQLNYVRKVDGIDHQVNELVFALFPERSGQLEIPPLHFTARQGAPSRGIFDPVSRSRTLRRSSNAVSVTVLPIPAEFPDSAWLPATALEISEDWSMDPAQMKVGDSATRTVTVKAGGLTGPQLPPLQEPELAGIKVYADRPQTENITASDGITALGINSAAWVITEPGVYRIPEISIPWWDTQADQLRYAAIPARTLSVAAAAIPASGAMNPPSGGLTPSPGNMGPNDAVGGAPAALSKAWPWISVALALGWLLTTLYFLRRKGVAPAGAQKAEKQNAARDALFREVRASCRAGQADKTRQLLLRLTTTLLPEATNPGLSQLQQLGNRELRTALQELDSALFSAETGDWDGAALASALNTLHSEIKANEKTAAGGGLPPLYAK